MDQRQVSLRLFSPMLYWVEKLGIDSGQARKLLGIELVGLMLVAVDQARLARVGDKYLVSALFEDPVHPVRMSTDLDGDLHLLFGVKAAAEIVGSRAQPTLLDHLAALVVEDIQITVLVAEVQSCRHLHLLGATIIHGADPPLSGLQRARILQTHAVQGTARGLALLISHLVFVDESGFNTSMTRLRARAPRGKRAYGKVPRNRGKNTTLIASITLEGAMGATMSV